MINFFYELSPVVQTILASLFSFLVTAFGSAMVFLVKDINKNKMDKLLSTSAGIMLASTIFSLINPSISYSESMNLSPALICCLGLLIGVLVLYLCEKIYEKTKKKK